MLLGILIVGLAVWIIVSVFVLGNKKLGFEAHCRIDIKSCNTFPFSLQVGCKAAVFQESISDFKVEL